MLRRVAPRQYVFGDLRLMRNWTSQITGLLPPSVAPIQDAEFAPSLREKGYADVGADLGLSSL
jgi:hypothetical protein